MQVEGNLVTGGIAAVAAHLDYRIVLYRRIAFFRICLLPQMHLHHSGIAIIQNLALINDALKPSKKRIIFLRVVRLYAAALLIAGQHDAAFAQDVLLFLHVGAQLRAVFLQILAQPHIVGAALRCAGECCIDIVGHILSFDFCHQITSYFSLNSALKATM